MQKLFSYDSFLELEVEVNKMLEAGWTAVPGTLGTTTTAMHTVYYVVLASPSPHRLGSHWDADLWEI